ncbi:MAG TPA: hypothetical protein VM101_02320 [Flavitalea sp.]|nr:hypothetical protein [Flavitalea sp.]
MKFNNTNRLPNNSTDNSAVRNSIQQEKEELISLFLANAHCRQLEEKFKRIDELNAKISKKNPH